MTVPHPENQVRLLRLHVFPHTLSNTNSCGFDSQTFLMSLILSISTGPAVGQIHIMSHAHYSRNLLSLRLQPFSFLLRVISALHPVTLLSKIFLLNLLELPIIYRFQSKLLRITHDTLCDVQLG